MEISLLVGVDVRVATADGMVLVEVQVGSESFAKCHGLEVVRKRGVERYNGLLSHMPDKQAAMLIATREATYKTTSYRRGLSTRLLRAVCERVDHGCQWILGRVLKLVRSTIQEFFTIYIYALYID